MKLTPSNSPKIRTDVLKPVFDKINNDENFRQLILESYRIALGESYLISPLTPLSQAICDLLPPELKRLQLRHDEVLQIVAAVKMIEAAASDRRVILHQEFLFADPTHPQYWIEKGKILASEDFLINAVRCFDKALEMGGNSGEALHRKGYSLLRVMTLVANAVNEIWNDMSRLQARTIDAIRCFERQIELDPSNAVAWYNKGVCLIELGRPTANHDSVIEAVNCFRKSLSIEPNDKKVKEALKACEKGASHIYARRLQIKPGRHVVEGRKGPKEFLKVLRQTMIDLPTPDIASIRAIISQITKNNPVYQSWAKHVAPHDFHLDDLGQNMWLKDLFNDLTSGISGESAVRIQRELGFCELRLRKANACCGTPTQYCYTYWATCGPLCKKSDYVGVRLFPCSAGCTEFEGTIIALHRGLMMVFHNILVLILGSLAVEFSYISGDRPEFFEPLISRDDAIRSIYQLIKRERQGAIPLPPRKVVFRNGRATMVGLVMSYVYLFVVAHELCHFLLRHRQEEGVGLQDNQKDGVEAFAWSKEQDKEFQADETALAILLNSRSGIGTDGAITFAIAGAEVTFLLLEICERIGRNHPSLTHPPAKDRIRRLRERYRFPDTYYGVSEAILSAGRGVLAGIVEKYAL